MLTSIILKHSRWNSAAVESVTEIRILQRGQPSILIGSSAVVLLLILVVTSTLAAHREVSHAQPQEATEVEKRFALVIGNSAYEHTDVLRNPVNDAADVKKSLSELGFVVRAGVNLNKREMESLIRQFSDDLKSHGGTGVFYYAGHGLQVNGENYLVPVDADIPEEDEVAYAAVPLNFLMSKLESANNNFNIVILDACRNNPFARSWRGYRSTGQNRGLTIVNPPAGTMILYAAKPGYVASDGPGRNGLFTEALLKYIKQPGLEYEELTRLVSLEVFTRSKQTQAPYKEGTKFLKFYFVNSPPYAESAQTARPLPSPDTRPPANVSYGDTLVTQNFSFKLLGCYLLNDAVGCDLIVTNLGAARSVGISAIKGSGSYLVSPNDVKLPALSVTTTEALNYKHAVCRMPSQGSCIYQLKFMLGFPQPTLFKTVRIDWTGGDEYNYGVMPPISFLNVKMRQKSVLDLGGRQVQQQTVTPQEPQRLDLGGRPIPRSSADPIVAVPPVNTKGTLLPTGVEITKEGIRFELNRCTLTEGREITCHLKLTNASANRRVYISSGGSSGTFLIDNHVGEKFYLLKMKHEDRDETGAGNYSPSAFNLLNGQTHRISLTFSVEKYLLPSNDYLKEFKLSWALGEPNAVTNYKWPSPIKFKDVPLVRGQTVEGGPINR